MSTNKSISYILCNHGITVNLYKLHFLSFSFFLQPNKRIFHPPIFSPLQSNTQEKKTKYFLSFYFSTLSIKRTLNNASHQHHCSKKKTLKSPSPLKNLGCLLPGGPPNPIKKRGH